MAHSARTAASGKSTYRRAFALFSANVLNQVLGAWLWTRAVPGRRAAGGRDRRQDRPRHESKGRKARTWSPPWRTASARSSARSPRRKVKRVPPVQELLKRSPTWPGQFSRLTRSARRLTRRSRSSPGGGYVVAVKANVPTLYKQLKKLPWAAVPAVSSVSTGPRPPGPPHHQGRARAGLDRVRRRGPGRAAAPHRHEEREEDRRGRLPDHQRQGRRPGRPGRLGPEPLEDRKLSSPGEGRDLPGRQIAGQDRKRAPRDGLAEEPGHQSPAPGRPGQHSSGQPSPPPRPAAHAKAASGCMNATLPCPWFAVAIGCPGIPRDEKRLFTGQAWLLLGRALVAGGTESPWQRALTDEELEALNEQQRRRFFDELKTRLPKEKKLDGESATSLVKQSMVAIGIVKRPRVLCTPFARAAAASWRRELSVVREIA